MEKLIESQKPEVPLVVEGGMSVGGGGEVVSTGFNPTCTTVATRCFNRSTKDLSFNLCPQCAPLAGDTFLFASFSAAKRTEIPNSCYYFLGADSAAHSGSVLDRIDGVMENLMKLRDWSFPRLKRDETETRPIESDGCG